MGHAFDLCRLMADTRLMLTNGSSTASLSFVFVYCFHRGTYSVMF